MIFVPHLFFSPLSPSSERATCPPNYESTLSLSFLNLLSLPLSFLSSLSNSFCHPAPAGLTRINLVHGAKQTVRQTLGREKKGRKG